MHLNCPPGLFVTSTGTSCGKTFVTRAIAHAWSRQGLEVSAIKPLETGCDHRGPLDALALERATKRHGLALDPHLYRTAPPLAPYAAALTTGHPPPDLALLADRVRALANGADRVLVEGAGGLLVPVGPRLTIADFARLLMLPLLVVAPDGLGVLSHVLTLASAVRQAELRLHAIVLVRLPSLEGDLSRATNAAILREHLDCPVLRFPSCPDDDAALADAADHCGLTTFPLGE